ncbi:MAG: ATP-binding protein [Gemmatimonadetes bacterium]|nr:ATP-binding protein [Gemmatimonadota bacterium]
MSASATTAATAAGGGHGSAPPVPPAPLTLHDTGLSAEAVSDLILKTLYVQGARSGQQLVAEIRLPFGILDEQLFTLQQRRLLEVRSTTGPGRGGYIFELSGLGRDRAKEAMEANLYVGPAPVPLEVYREWIEKQSIRREHTTRARVEAGFSHLVLDREIIEMLGPAINSSHSVFLHGDPGNGKTAIAEAIANMMGGSIYLPYAVEISGQIMMLYDPVYHRALDGDGLDPARPGGAASGPDWLRNVPEHDERFVRIARPVVFVGGELTLEQLDLQYDLHSKIYQAPFQLKAAGGVLIIDDFGRQQVAPKDLLNRWIVPLEKRVDYLTLHTGIKFPVPFDCLLLFATNLHPHELVDEAFLRRIQYKVQVESPSRKNYELIFQRVCASRNVEYDPAAVEFIYRYWYELRGIQPRGCHPRDIVEHLLDIVRFEERPAVLAPDLLDRACRSYFLVQNAAQMGL